MIRIDAPMCEGSVPTCMSAIMHRIIRTAVIQITHHCALLGYHIEKSPSLIALFITANPIPGFLRKPAIVARTKAGYEKAVTLKYQVDKTLAKAVWRLVGRNKPS